MQLFLIGPMGSGKTTVGGLIAKHFNLPFYDMDKIIEAQEKSEITSIFESMGEEYFRQIETTLLKKLVGLNEGIISTGGGIIKENENRKILSNQSHVVYLETSVSSQLLRLKDDDTRPILRVDNKLQKLEEIKIIRDPLYKECAKFTLNTDNLGVGDVFLIIQTIMGPIHPVLLP